MAEDYRKYLDPKTLAKLKGLDLKARLIVEGYVAGFHKSPYHGFSIEFAEHREYVPGDDLRYVDWKVWGKTDKYYLKQYEQETNLACYLLLDTSESMRYRSDAAPVSKLEYARYVAAALAFLVLQQQDAVGLVTFDREVRQFARASSHPSHLKQILHLMHETVPERKTSIGPIFHDLAERIKKRGIVVILSDLFDDVSSMKAIVFQVLDPAEIDFPFQDTTLFKGLESLPEVLAEPRALRRAYQKEFHAFLDNVKKGCRINRIDYLQLRTNQKLDVALSGYLAARLARAK